MVLANSTDLWMDSFPCATKDGNKYSRGHVAVVTAHSHLTGAAKLASSAVLRSGAGLVTIICPEDLLALYSSPPFAIMYKGYEAQSEISDFIENRKIDACLIGPGLSDNKETKELTLRLLEMEIPCVIDAGAISCFKDCPEILLDKLKNRKIPAILTPHQGEFEKIFGEIHGRLEAVEKAVKETSSVILLKGSETIISDNKKVILNPEASPYLATAGSGDVLAGIITALCAGGMESVDAASAGVWIHSECANNFGAGLIADDIIDEIPAVLKSLMKLKSHSQ